MIGIVIRENSVLVSKHFDAYTGSDPYFSARSAVVLPAGIAVRITAHPVMIGSAFNRRMIKSARNGNVSLKKGCAGNSVSAACTAFCCPLGIKIIRLRCSSEPLL